MNFEDFVLNSSSADIWEPPESSVSDYILRKLKECEEKNGSNFAPSITNPVTGESHKYLDFDSLSLNVANTLKSDYAFQKGDTLIYSAHNGANLHVFLLGVWRANGIIRSSYPEDTKGELLTRIQESHAKFLLCDESQALDCLEIIETKISWKVHVIVFGNVEGCVSASSLLNNVVQDPLDGNISKSSKPEAFSTSPDGIALILPTSGTTGNSKGAIYTHKKIIKTLALLETLPLNDAPTSFTLLMGKQTHVTGCLFAFAKISAGHNLLMLNQISTPIILQVVKSHKPKSIFLFPKFLNELVQHHTATSSLNELSSIEFVATAGMIVGPELMTTAKQLPNLKAFIVCYGMTECGLLTTNVEWISNHATNNNICSRPINDLPPYSCGKLVPGTSLMIKDVAPLEENTNIPENNNCHSNGLSSICHNTLSPGQLGELYFKSPISFNGYLNNSKETEETLTTNGWIRTGDLGYYDKNGFVFVTDRVKDTFKYFNNHISPTEIEQIIQSHDSVKESCVLGVSDPNGGDMIPRAFVVLKPTNNGVLNKDDTEKIAKEIKEFANRKLPSYKQLKAGLFILNSLPYGKSGKLCRNALKQFEVPAANKYSI